MGAGDTFVLAKPARRRRASFVLTSLIDVIFLLVIFFMVSSQIVPFSLIPLEPAEPATSSPPADGTTAAPTAIRILAGQVSIGGKAVPMKELAKALEGLVGAGITSILLIPGAGSTVQDLVTTLEASKGAGFASVTILNRQVAAP